MKFHIIKDGKIIPATLEEWALWFDTEERIIFQDEVEGVQVSTIFLGYSLEHSTARKDASPQFETLISGNAYSLKVLSNSYEDALFEHNVAIDSLKRNIVNSVLMRIKSET